MREVVESMVERVANENGQRIHGRSNSMEEEARSRKSSLSASTPCSNPFHNHVDGEAPSTHSADNVNAMDNAAATSEMGDENYNSSSNVALGIKSAEEDDAFRIFHVLCRLSEKNADSSDVRSHELRSIILSLDMILLIVQNVHPELLHDKHSFIWVMRVYLCKALTMHAASPVHEVFVRVLSIFVQLANKFKNYLKSHIEVCLFFK